MKLFIHRWFGGSVHVKKPWNDKHWDYPRLANTVVPLFIAVAILHAFNIPDRWLLVSRIGWGAVLVGLFLYTAWNPLNLREWYECYRKYWEGKGYRIDRIENAVTSSVNYWEVVTPNETFDALDFEQAISYLFCEIYGKWPMRV